MGTGLIDWQRRTGEAARPAIEGALAASDRGDLKASARCAREAARVFLRAFLDAAGVEGPSDDVTDLVGTAAGCDRWFDRVRPEAALLQRGWRRGDAGGCEPFLEAMKEIRLLAGARAGAAMGFSNRAPDGDPRLREFVVHATTAERAVGIFRCGSLYSYNACAARGFLSAPAPGVEHLLDPRRCLGFVMFGIPDHQYYAGEKVANAHRKGWIDEGLEEDYQPSVRLFFRCEDLRALPGHEEDGVHELMVRDEVGLELLAYAVFPTEEAREAALAVMEPGRRERFKTRCLVAPAECRGEPRAYVARTNGLVLEAEADRAAG